MPRLRTRLTLAALAVLGLAGAPAQAAFPFASCSTSPNYDAPIPVNIGATEFGLKPEAPAGGATDGVRYNLDTTSSWSLFVNPNVVKIQPYYGYFQTESGYDIFKVTDQVTTYSYSGSLNGSNTPVAAASTWQPQQGFGIINELDLQWTSDYSVAAYTPPAFTQVAVQCMSNPITTPINTFQIGINKRVDGLLIATGDVLYFKVPQPANTPMLLSLDFKGGTSGADFDLYASTTNTFPDNSNYTWIGYSSNPSEVIDVPASATSRTLYLAVHSYSGAGHFSLHAYAMASTERFNLTVCPVGFTPDATQQAKIRDFLQTGSAYLLSVSNGNTFIKSFNVSAQVSSCLSSCSICLEPTGSVSYGNHSINPQGCGQIDFGGSNWGGGGAVAWLFAHEAGHSCFGLPDEYEPPPAGSGTPALCGHTIMNNHGYSRTYCTIDHCKDGHMTDTSRCDPASSSNWDIFTAGSHYHFGPDFAADGVTADPTPIYNNPQLRSLVTVTF